MDQHIANDTLLNSTQNISIETEYSILKVLVYFGIFRYPLTTREIHAFTGIKSDEKKIANSLNKLSSEKKLYKLGNFYSLSNDHSLIERRLNGNALASELIVHGKKISQLIFRFPYVRAVGICGSISKNFADEMADIDYVVITKANRLWIARTLLMLYRKIPLIKNRNKHYCMNYFLDEADLVIAEKNIYTATELFTVIPTADSGVMHQFFEKNTWSSPYFPNKNYPASEKITPSRGLLKKTAELLFNNRIGDWLDNYLLNLTTRRWKKKQDEGRLNTKGERMGFDTGKHFCKPTTIFFHDRFLKSYNKSLKEYCDAWKI